jgi:hypothetical protein
VNVVGIQLSPSSFLTGIHLRRAGNIQFFKLPKFLRAAVALFTSLSVHSGAGKTVKRRKIRIPVKKKIDHQKCIARMDFAGFGGIIINKKRENG